MRFYTRSHHDSRAALAFCGGPGHSGSRGNRCTQLGRNDPCTAAHRGRQHTRHNLQQQGRDVISVNTRGESHIHLQYLSFVFDFFHLKMAGNILLTDHSTSSEVKVNSKIIRYTRKDIQTVFPTFRNALAQHKLEALAAFLSVKYQMEIFLRRKS